MFKPGDEVRLTKAETDPPEQRFNTIEPTAEEVQNARTSAMSDAEAIQAAKVEKFRFMSKVPMEPVEVIPKDTIVTVIGGVGENTGTEANPAFPTYYVETKEGRKRQVKAENLARLS
ncbi:MAG: hypothetical protein K2X38_00260 [Gemmataceae bacterium]|nr:hypothetical protein [Gemmataceae bacterium]